MIPMPVRLGPKLNFVFAAFLLLLGGATALLVYLGFERSQNGASDRSREGLERQGGETLQGEVQTQVFVGQLLFDRAATVASQSSTYMTSPRAGATVAWDSARLSAGPTGELRDTSPGRVSDALVLQPGPLTPEQERDLRESANLDALAPMLLEGFDLPSAQTNFDAIAVYYVGLSGAMRYYPPIGIADNIATGINEGAPFADLGPERNPERATVWTAPYADAAGRGFVLTAYTPVYDGEAFRGVVGVDLSLDRLIAQLDSIKPAVTGYAFYTDRNGQLLESASSEFLGAALNDPENTAFAATVDSMRNGETGLRRVRLGGREVFVAYAPLGEVGGSLAVVAPVDELTVESLAIGDEIQEEGDRTLIFTLFTLAGFFAVALLASAWFYRRVLVEPIESLVRGTRAIAGGNLETRIPVRSADELGMLADSFNTMTNELAISRDRLDTQREQLQSSEAELRALFTAMTDVIIVIDRTGLIHKVAPTSATTGWRFMREEVVGRLLQDIIGAEHAQQSLATIARVLDTRVPATIEYEVDATGAGDQARSILATLSAMSEDAVVWVARDVTARKAAEAALREREEQYRSIFESANDGLIITSFEDGAIVDVNTAASRMHGYTIDEFRALHPTQFIHPEDHHLFATYMTVVAAGGEYRCRARDVRKDGSQFHVEVLGTPVTYHGERHVLGVVRDITEQVEAERVLERRVAERTGELSALVDVSQAVASTLDLRSLIGLLLDRIRGVVEYTGTSLLTREGDDLVIIDSRGPVQQAIARAAMGMRFPLSGLDEFWAAMMESRPIIIDDVQSDETWAKTYRRALGAYLDLPAFQYVRSWLAVPLMAKDRAIGMLSLSSDKPSFFTEEQARLVVAIGAQGAAAIENARLFEQTQERTRELSALLDVSRSVASALSIDDVVESILTEVGALLDMSTASLVFIEDGVGTNLGASPEVKTRRGQRFKMPGPVLDSVRHRRPVVIGDLQGDSELAVRYRADVGPEWMELRASTRSWMSVPLIHQGRATGVLIVTHSQADHYDERDMQLAAAIANQAAVALENARLFEETEERTRELATLLDVARTVGSTIELRPLLALVLEQVGMVADYEQASLMFVEGDDLTVFDVRAPGLTGRALEALRASIGRRFPLDYTGAVWQEWSAGRSVVIKDVRAEDDEFARSFRRAAGDLFERGFRTTTSWMGVPVSHKGSIVGVLALSHSRAGAFTQREAGLATAIGAQAAIAVENARLFEQANEQAREMATLVEVSRNVGSTLELRPLMQLVLEQVRSVAPYDRASILLVEDDTLTVFAVLEPSGSGETLGAPVGTRFPFDQARTLFGYIQEGAPLRIDDVHSDDSMAAAYRSAVGPQYLRSMSDVRSWLGIPLALKDRVIGVIALSRVESTPFTARQAELAGAIGQQAAMAVDNARLYEETQRRSHELATLLDVSRSVSSTLELRPLLDLVLEQLEKVTGFDRASVLGVGEGGLHVLAVRDQRGVPSGAPPGAVFPIEGGGGIWANLAAGKPVIIKDVRGEGEFAEVFRSQIAPQVDPELRRVRAWMGVPLAAQDRIIGIVALSSERAGSYTQRDAQLAMGIAGQAAVAMENARLYEETQRRAQELTTLLDVSRNVTSTLDLRPLLDLILDQVKTVADYDRATVMFLDGGDMTIFAMTEATPDGLDLSAAVGIRYPLERAPRLSAHLLAGESLIIDDVLADTPDAADFRALGVPQFGPSVANVRSWMAAPLQLKDKVIGVITCSSYEVGRFSPRQLELLRAIANQASIAVENARLYGRAAHAASLEERQRLARELHDSVSQALYGIALGARTARTLLDRSPERAVEPVEYVLSLAEAGLAEMRALIFELRPESLETEGLVVAIEKHVASTRARYGLDVAASLCEEPDASIETKEAAYRIAQEALHNVVKHARATHVDVRLACTEDRVTLEVHDNGAGFDPGNDFAGHLGLRSMRERALMLGGSLEIQSAAGRGARIVASLPRHGRSLVEPAVDLLPADV